MKREKQTFPATENRGRSNISRFKKGYQKGALRGGEDFRPTLGQVWGGGKGETSSNPDFMSWGGGQEAGKGGEMT